MISLALLLGGAVLTFIVVITLGVAFYEIVIVKRVQDDHNYTRTYDWTSSDRF